MGSGASVGSMPLWQLLRHDTALRNALVCHDFYPGIDRAHDLAETHTFDGAEHRFKHNGSESGWYIALPNRKGAVFGDHATGSVYRHRFEPPPEIRDDWWAAQGAKERAKARVQARRLWDAGISADRHPELHKGIDDSVRRMLRISAETDLGDGVVVEAGLLLVPMEINGLLVNVQRIWPDGKKRYLPGGVVIGAACVIGGSWTEDKRGFITRGLATGGVIHHVTNCPVAVCFLEAAIEPVTKRLLAMHPEAEFIIAADNDRWSVVETRDGHDDIPNPGVHYATEAEEDLGERVRVAIPDFHDLKEKPATFADLFRLEGAEAVETRLDPQQAKRAVIVHESVEPTAMWPETAPFSCLGFYREVYFYLPRGAIGQVVDLAEAAHTESHLLTLCPDVGWWAKRWPPVDAETRVDWLLAGRALREECHRVGIYDPTKTRGRGAWHSGDGDIVIHTGDKVLSPLEDEYLEPQEYREGACVYPKLPAVGRPDLASPLSLDQCRDLLRVFRKDIPWDAPAYGVLLAGWTAQAPFTGVLDHLPHVYVHSPDVGGKATVVGVVERLLGGTGLRFDADSGYAKVLAALDLDHLPVLYEATKSGKAARHTTDRVLRLATRPGVRSMFLLASKDKQTELLEWKAEEASVAILRLQPKHTVGRQRRKVQTKAMLEETARLTRDTGRQLMGRVLPWMRSGDFAELLACAQRSLAQGGLSSMEAELYGSLVAGAWPLQADHVPDEPEMTDWLHQIGIDYLFDERANLGLQILALLLDARETIEAGERSVEVTVGDLVESVREKPDFSSQVPRAAADRHLKTLGLRVHYDSLLIANRSEWVKRQLLGTRFADTWINELRKLDGVRAGPFPIRFAGKQSRTSMVPLHLVQRNSGGLPSQEEVG